MGVRTTIILSCLAMLALAPVAQACRIIPDVWPPRPPTVMPPPPAYLASPILTRAHTAEIDITDNVAKVSVAATFYNPNGGVMEGTYFFPIEPDAVIRDFSMLINGKEQKAELLDADKARQIYEDIVRQMKDPGLLEYVGTRMLKARVYPIPARGEVQVRLQYHQVVTSDGGLSHFRYPLLSAKPNAETIDNVALRVSLNSSAPVKLFYSPSHVIDAIRKGDRAVTGGFEQEKVVPEQDFDLYWSIDASDIGVSTLAYQPKGEDGYCLISMTPKVDFAKDRVEPKDVVFVFDKSGSMAGDKMKQAKAALAYCLNSLAPADRFAVILFSTELDVVTDALVPAEAERVAAARERVDKAEARGGTAIYEALQKACGLFTKGDRLGMIVFMTDGRPTIGPTDITEILKAAKAANTTDVRLFVFGVGNDVNTDLLDLLATENRGTQTYVAEKEDIEVKVSSFYEKVAMPVLTDVSVTAEGVKFLDLYPRQAPDIFRGGHVLLFGRYRGAGRHDVVVHGKAMGKDQTFQSTANFDGDDANAFLPAIWAHRKVAFLLEEIRTRGNNKELEGEIIELGKRYGIVTPYTSFLIVEDNLPEPQRLMLSDARRKFEGEKGGFDAVGMSRGVVNGKMMERAPAAEAMNFGFAPGLASAGRMGAGGGESMVVGSAVADDGAGASPLRKAARSQVRKVADKVFYLQDDGLHYDSLFVEEDRAKITEIKYLSDEYFALADKHPGIGKYLAAKMDMVICVGRDVYRIRE